MLILGLQGEGHISKVISVMAYTRIQEARASAYWHQEWGAGISPFLAPHSSFLLVFIVHHVLQYSIHTWKISGVCSFPYF